MPRDVQLDSIDGQQNRKCSETEEDEEEIHAICCQLTSHVEELPPRPEAGRLVIVCQKRDCAAECRLAALAQSVAARPQQPGVKRRHPARPERNHDERRTACCAVFGGVCGSPFSGVAAKVQIIIEITSRLGTILAHHAVTVCNRIAQECLEDARRSTWYQEKCDN
eukprot:460836-Prymnesium_polylepis.2